MLRSHDCNRMFAVRLFVLFLVLIVACFAAIFLLNVSASIVIAGGAAAVAAGQHSVKNPDLGRCTYGYHTGIDHDLENPRGGRGETVFAFFRHGKYPCRRMLIFSPISSRNAYTLTQRL